MAIHEFNHDDSFNQRLLQEFYDSYDEELEMELDDLRFDDAEVDSVQKKAWRKQYFRELLRLQGELVKLQDWVMRTGHRLVIIFEGRDAAGKGGVIKRITQRLNPRTCRVAALPAPNDRERTHRAPAGRRRNGVVRSQLVQPCRSGKSDGLLQRRRIRRVFPQRAGVREDADAQRHSNRQVLVLDHRR